MASSPFAFITILTTDTVNKTTSDEIAIGATTPCTASQNTSSIVNNNLFEQIKTICTAWLSDYKPFDGVMPSDWVETPLSDIAEFISG